MQATALQMVSEAEAKITRYSVPVEVGGFGLVTKDRETQREREKQ